MGATKSSLDAYRHITFGSNIIMNNEGDLVLVYMGNSPAFFARIEAIVPDIKPEWYQVKLLVLQVPLLVITWILRRPYIDGEIFTMGGKTMHLEQVVSPEEEKAREEEPAAVTPSEGSEKAEEGSDREGPKPGPGRGKVVSLLDRRKKH